jgi:ComF family protein
MPFAPFARSLAEALLHLIYPHCCPGCGNTDLPAEQPLCLRCLLSLPLTGFHSLPDNSVEKIFWGRLPIEAATAHLYFTRASLVQRLVHSFKYAGNRELALFLGRQLGQALLASGRFAYVQLLLPLPLHPDREHLRGYNQATLLCQGIAEVMGLPLNTTALCRDTATESQTRKNRVERWQNMENRFLLRQEEVLRNRHVLLVDDALTTGATLEACGRALLRVPGLQLSLATLCFSSR